MTTITIMSDTSGGKSPDITDGMNIMKRRSGVIVAMTNGIIGAMMI